VRKEFQEEVSSSADPLLLQPTVYLMDSQDGQHEYPVGRRSRRSVPQLIHSLLLQSIIFMTNSQDGQHEYPVSEEVNGRSILKLIHYCSDYCICS
jgi:hypothetical protein